MEADSGDFYRPKARGGRFEPLTHQGNDPQRVRQKLYAAYRKYVQAGLAIVL
jgi:hypothetical protein